MTPFVVVVARGVPDASSPLLGRFEFDQALALQQAGCHVVVAVLDCRSPRRRRAGLLTPWRVRHSTFEGLPVARVDIGLGSLPVRAFVPLLGRAWRRLYEAVVEHHGRPDVVHAHFTRWAAGVVPTTLRLRDGADQPLVVVTEHSSKLRRGSVTSEDRALARHAYRADRVLAVSSALAEVLAAEFGVTATVVPDLVDVDAFQPHPAHPTHPAQPAAPTRLLSVGNLIPRKGMDRLLRAFAAAFATSDAELVIVGQGPERGHLEELVTSSGVGDRVRLTGGLGRAELAAEFAAADGFVLFSEWETFGVVYVEAMAAGLPVLATHCGGPEDFVTDDVGMFTGTTPEDDVAALKTFVSQLDTFDPAVIAALARVRYAPGAVAARLLEIYRG
ncbi:glycosyltransferase [Aestuariimicrobium sp. T2.26MG-19.2B]|uniref:glycosyltransferase n=1 Tax=Aestuariimicrobium sp. T2.26MG-19.2B TaxID=3040679 RepID=UPI0024775891|nr:glycosyltransferase [Aestuariimicrobium sp. T2.26MG-19.2B]CAI9399913.1 D-inositol-3-phosphate glycosyltransferase [Aestuariimicrobium sp. T2.26MG-19.2B]